LVQWWPDIIAFRRFPGGSRSRRNPAKQLILLLLVERSPRCCRASEGRSWCTL